MKRFNLFGETVNDQADTVLVDPDTGYPVLHDAVTACNCSVNGTRKVCAMPGYCHTLHRMAGVITGPDDDTLKQRPVSEQDSGWPAVLMVLALGGGGFALSMLAAICTSLMGWR